MTKSKTDFQYLNLHIEKVDDTGNFTSIIRDNGGAIQAKHNFRYSIDRHVLSRLEDMLIKDFRQSANIIENFGSELYSAVFGGEVAGYFKSLLKKGDDIRLNLIFKRNQTELYRLPWEFLYDGDKFLCAYPQINLSRSLEGLETDDKPPIEGKIRILAVVSSPLDLKDYERLQIEQEQVMILQALDSSIAAGRMEVEFLDEASLRNIQERLDEEEHHILHYTGHGVYREDEDRGYLVMENDTGKTRPVDNRDVADLLAGYKSLRLVVLSGCQTAKTSGRQALRDMATPLLTKKIPSVIAMQYSVSDHSATSFATKLYSEIANGYPVDVALTRARRDLRLDDKFGRVEFATPVLWSNNPDCLAIDESKLKAPDSGIKPSKPLTLKENIFLGLERLGNQFIGRRAELRRIKEDFLNRGTRVVVLHGIGGIGKTVTASKVVEKLAEHFRLIYAFDCRENLTPELIMMQLNDFFKANGIDAFDPILKSDAPVTMKINQLAQLLSQIKSLLIFDNFESLLAEDKNSSELKDDDLKKALKDLITQCSDGSKFLFTTRYTFNLTDGRMTNLIDEINLGE
ncbi:MAG: CHAT domain-containing protein, partial [candidate division Zixibacteria bacterium]|nr:CHAT domain-containing protein [candidate division Zixibacteria bacterium]